MALLTAHGTAGWQRKLLQQCEDSLLAKNCEKSEKKAQRRKKLLDGNSINSYSKFTYSNFSEKYAQDSDSQS